MREQAYLIAYDISCPKRRARVARRLEASAARVQKSVFVARLTAASARRLQRALEGLMDMRFDSLLIEPVAGRGFTRVHALIF
jgi:CRISPR-associated protein Cas2